jgi:hypothetical protein
MMIFLTLLASATIYMTPQQKEQTGLSKLTKKEQTALEEWIYNHYEKRAYPLLSPKKAGRRPHIEENFNGGRQIRLSDDTCWKIHPSDAPIAQGWITPVEIGISESGESEYPHRLTNSLTGSSIRALQTRP